MTDVAAPILDRKRLRDEENVADHPPARPRLQPSVAAPNGSQDDVIKPGLPGTSNHESARQIQNSLINVRFLDMSCMYSRVGQMVPAQRCRSNSAYAGGDCSWTTSAPEKSWRSSTNLRCASSRPTRSVLSCFHKSPIFGELSLQIPKAMAMCLMKTPDGYLTSNRCAQVSYRRHACQLCHVFTESACIPT
jgi:hypothetical protein